MVTGSAGCSPRLGEVARASLARGAELCGAAFWRKNQFYSFLRVVRGCIGKIIVSRDRYITCPGLYTSRGERNEPAGRHAQHGPNPGRVRVRVRVSAWVRVRVKGRVRVGVRVRVRDKVRVRVGVRVRVRVKVRVRVRDRIRIRVRVVRVRV